MLKISTVEDSRQYRLILEGKLIAPWTVELTTACKAARADLNGRQLVVDLRSLTAISSDGERVLLQLMSEDIAFQCGVFMKEVLRQLPCKRQRTSRTAATENAGLDQEQKEATPSSVAPATVNGFLTVLTLPRQFMIRLLRRP